MQITGRMRSASLTALWEKMSIFAAKSEVMTGVMCMIDEDKYNVFAIADIDFDNAETTIRVDYGSQGVVESIEIETYWSGFKYQFCEQDGVVYYCYTGAYKGFLEQNLLPVDEKWFDVAGAEFSSSLCGSGFSLAEMAARREEYSAKMDPLRDQWGTREGFGFHTHPRVVWNILQDLKSLRETAKLTPKGDRLYPSDFQLATKDEGRLTSEYRSLADLFCRHSAWSLEWPEDGHAWYLCWDPVKASV